MARNQPLNSLYTKVNCKKLFCIIGLIRSFSFSTHGSTSFKCSNTVKNILLPLFPQINSPHQARWSFRTQRLPTCYTSDKILLCLHVCVQNKLIRHCSMGISCFFLLSPAENIVHISWDSYTFLLNTFLEMELMEYSTWWIS